MRKNRNGFTLVELLLVIAILAIVVAITIPMVAEITDNSKRKAFYLYGINLLSKATEHYIATYSNLDSFSHKQYEEAECVVYNIKEDLSIKNTGNYEGWVRVRRKPKIETEDNPITSKIATVKLTISPIPTEEENEAEFNRNHKYIDGILYPKYCITSEEICSPNENINVQEYQYELEINKVLQKGETLCANYQYVNGSGALESTLPICKPFTATDNLLLASDYQYEVVVAYKDNTFAVQNLNMEGMKETDFNAALELSMDGRKDKDITDKLIIYKPRCKFPQGFVQDPEHPVDDPGYDTSISLGKVTTTTTKQKETTEKTTNEKLLLKSLTVSEHDIGFNPGVTSYSFEVPNSVTTLHINAEAKDPKTKVTYDKTVELGIGNNRISIILEDETGNATRYSIYVIRLNSNTTRTTVSTTTTTRSTMSKSVVVYTTRSITTAPGAPDPSLPESNTQLEFLTISKHQDFEFDPTKNYYDLKVDKNEDMLYLNYRAKNPKSTVIVTGNSNLKNGSQVEILIRSENGYYTSSYIINIYREGSTISYTLLFRIIAIVLGIILFVVLIWLTLARRSMRPKKNKQIQVVTKTTQSGPSTSVFDNQPKKVVVNTNQNNNDNNNNTN